MHTLYGLNEDDNDLLDALCDLFQSTPLEVFHIAYCEYFSLSIRDEWQELCQEFVSNVKQYMPAMLQKQKIHLILHLTECMEQFGPSSAFNAERFESLNSRVCTFNVFSNRLAPSRDMLQHLQFLCHDGQMMAEERCSLDLKELLSSDVIQHVICGIPYKELRKSRANYQPGSARKVAHSSAMLSTLPLHAVGYQQPISIEALQQSDSSYTIFMDNLVMDQLVTPCAAIVSLDSSLVNVGDYIEISSVHDQCQYGILMAVSSGEANCIVQGFHSMNVSNEYSCPVLELSKTIFTTSSLNIQRPSLLSEVVFLKMPSRNQKKRSKQRAEYLQKREDILSQENKAKARARYKADPEKKKASVRDTYNANAVSKRAAKRQRYQEGVEENRAAKRQRYQEGVEENRAANRRIYRGNSATIKAARRSRYWKGRRTTTTTQSYSLFEPNSRTLAEYGVRLEKAILRDSELLSEVNNAFCNSHPLLAQKVVTRSARAAAGSLLKTIRKVNAKKLQESDILVGHRFHTAVAEPYFFDNSKSVEENHAAKRQQYQEDVQENRAAKRQRYQEDVEENRAAKRQRYQEDVEENRAAKRQRYQEDVEDNHAAKRQRYQEDVEENRAAKRQRYQEDVEENRAAKRQ
ncbi:hypothetical protein EMCRGX_G004936 [Ephydatia muelleri]